MRLKTLMWAMMITLVLAGVVAAEEEIGHTPPRLSLVNGQVSFWRPGAQDWVEAQVNTALAAGDQLYAGPDGNFELQIGSRAFVRGATDTQIGLENQASGFLQFEITAGQAALDLRSFGPGTVVEVGTPHAAFTLANEGYYRIGVDDTQATITTRRGGQADALTAGGATVSIGPNETVTLSAGPANAVARQSAVPLDSWDQWNYDRTGRQLEAVSTRYVAPETYGVSDLDQYGTWRTVPTYGPVWRPNGVSSGWAPYSTGSWMRDPYYGWTWVDSAPWGWAPYHYGRWVHVNGYWSWAPGPRVVRPVYAPALVAFFGAPGLSVGVSLGSSSVGWVSLGWGEPLLPWWGRPGFINRPWWGGWGGPRRINGRAVPATTVVQVTQINHYHNTRVPRSMVVVDRERFGGGPIRPEHFRNSEAQRLRPLHSAPGIAARPESYVPNTRPGPRPPAKNMQRAVVRARTHKQDHRPAPGAPSHIRPQEKPRVSGHTLPEQQPRRSGGLQPGTNQETRFGRQSPMHTPKRTDNEKDRPSGRPPASSQVKPFGRAADPQKRTEGTTPERPKPERPKLESPSTPRRPQAPPRPHVGGSDRKPPAVRFDSHGERPNRIELRKPAKPLAPPQRPADVVSRPVRPAVVQDGNAAKNTDVRRSRPGNNNFQKQNKPENRPNVLPGNVRPPTVSGGGAVKSYSRNPAAPASNAGRNFLHNRPATEQGRGQIRPDRQAPGATPERLQRPQGVNQQRVTPGVERVVPSRAEPGATHGVGQHRQGGVERQPRGDSSERSGRGRFPGR